MARRKRALALLTLAAAVAAATPGGARAADAEEGRAIFESKCASCHTIGAGDTVGPDLADVASRRGRAWLERFIKEPDAVIASGDPIAAELLDEYGVAMPSLGLTDDEVASLLTYLGAGAEPASAPAEPAPAPQPAPAEGDPDTGKNLFTGADRFANDGPPCMSCHSIAGIGALGGGALGPDLTGAYEKYGGAQGIASILATLPFPTMVPVFDGRPLTAAEQADLASFLQEAARSDRPGWAIGKLVLLSLGGAAALVAFALLAWRHRLVAVRRALVNRSSPRRK